MAELRWPRRGRFTDDERDLDFEGPGVFDVPDDAVDTYLDRGWEQPDGSTDSGDAADGQDAASDADSDRMDWDAFQDMGYEDRVSAVQNGQVDHLLDRVIEDDTSKNVVQAAEDRQEETGA